MCITSVIPIELDALVHLRGRLIDQTDGLGAVPALVGLCHFELMPGGMKMLERGLHVRLIGDGAGREKSTDAGRDENEEGGDESPRGTRNGS
jgi:hypothetical protein